MTLTTSPSRTPAPMASQCASNAPTGIGMPAASQASPPNPARGGRQFDRRCDIARCSFSRMPSSSGSTATRNSSGGSPPSDSFHSHLWPMAQTLRGASRRIGDAAQHRRHHVAMLEGGDELVALLGIVPQPVQQLRKAPLGGIDAAAPVDGFESVLVRLRGDLRRFAPGAMIAPEIVIVERRHAVADRNDARTGSIERNRAATCEPSNPGAAARRASAWPRPARSCGRRGFAWRGPDRSCLRCSGYSAVPDAEPALSHCRRSRHERSEFRNLRQQRWLPNQMLLIGASRYPSRDSACAASYTTELTVEKFAAT